MQIYELLYLAKICCFTVIEDVHVLIFLYRKSCNTKFSHQYFVLGQAPVQILLAMGPDAGIGITKGGLIMPNFLSVRFKSKNLFINDMWKLLKQKRPKS